MAPPAMRAASNFFVRAVTLFLLSCLIALGLIGCSGHASAPTNAGSSGGGSTSGGGSGGGGSGGGGSGGGGGGGGGSSSGVPAADHVFLVVLENHGFAQVVGSPAMPYLNSLATQNVLAANYFANTHPSIGNYFMMTVGAIETNDDAFAGTVTDDNLVRALTGAGKSWKAYAESLPAVGYTGNDIFPYIKHHNPFAYLSDVTSSSVQAANLVPLTQLAPDMNAGHLPNFAFLLPNIQNDAHDCPAGIPLCTDSDKLAAADAWLKNNVDPIIRNAVFSNSILIITFDEALDSDITNGGGHVATVVLGAHVKTGFSSSTLFQHQDTLRLILEALSVSDRPNGTANAHSMAEFFQ
jgi:acid phosphatase